MRCMVDIALKEKRLKGRGHKELRKFTVESPFAGQHAVLQDLLGDGGSSLGHRTVVPHVFDRSTQHRLVVDAVVRHEILVFYGDIAVIYIGRDLRDLDGSISWNFSSATALKL